MVKGWLQSSCFEVVGDVLRTLNQWVAIVKIVGKPSPFPVYRESKRKFYLPRFYGLKHYGNPEAETLSTGQNITLSFKGQLRPYQIPLVNTYLKKAKKTGCGLLDADCGAGKTSCAIYILAEYRKKTLVLQKETMRHIIKKGTWSATWSARSSRPWRSRSTFFF